MSIPGFAAMSQHPINMPVPANDPLSRAYMWRQGSACGPRRAWPTRRCRACGPTRSPRRGAAAARRPTTSRCTALCLLMLASWSTFLLLSRSPALLLSCAPARLLACAHALLLLSCGALPPHWLFSGGIAPIAGRRQHAIPRPRLLPGHPGEPREEPAVGQQHDHRDTLPDHGRRGLPPRKVCHPHGHPHGHPHSTPHQLRSRNQLPVVLHAHRCWLGVRTEPHTAGLWGLLAGGHRVHRDIRSSNSAGKPAGKPSAGHGAATPGLLQHRSEPTR